MKENLINYFEKQFSTDQEKKLPYFKSCDIKKIFLLLLIINIAFNNHSYGQIDSCSTNDSLTLLTFYNSVSGLNWDLSQSVNNWQGVNLNSNGCVVKLELENEINGGIIPPDLGSLYFLEELDLENCNLSGSIPAELGNLQFLTELDLEENDLTGEIPASLGNLIDLQYLVLAQNELSGSIPASFGNLTNLTNIYLWDNNLTGCYAPALNNLCNVSNSSITYLNNFDEDWVEFCNDDSGACLPEQSCRYQDSLTLLAFYENFESVGSDLTLPMDTWAGITLNENGCVVEINHNDCCIYNGSISPVIANLSHLEVLIIDEINLDQPIPPEIGNLSNLRLLALDGCELFGSIPPELGNLTNLFYLKLGSNNLTGEIPDELSDLVNLTYLNLWHNNLTGSIPASFSNLQNLEFLYLRGNQLSGCYDPALLDLCPLGFNNFQVSDGNNFDADWEEFCFLDNESCLNFNSDESDRVEASSDVINQIGSGDFTFEAWIDPDINNIPIHPTIFSNRSGNIYSGTIFFIHDFWGPSDHKMLCVQIGGFNHMIINNGTYNGTLFDGNSHHIAITKEQLLLYYYIDGQLIGTVNANPTTLNKNSSLVIGGDNVATNNHPFNGVLYDLRIWKTARTASQIQNNMFNTLTGDETDLVANWLFDEENGQIVYDNSVNGYDGVLGTNNNTELQDPEWDINCNNPIPNGICTTEDPEEVCAVIDSLTLLSFYDSVTGLNWDLTQPVNSWQGVTLNSDGCVVKLELENELTGGIISPVLANLYYLEELDLENCNLTGTIPSELGNFSFLTELDLESNNLTGTIPESLGNLNTLQYLVLAQNDLTGSVPYSFVDLINLNNLYLWDNNLSGCYQPILNSLCNIPNISISYLNNFDTDWIDFCNYGTGICIPEESCRYQDSLSLLAFFDNFNDMYVDLSGPMDTWNGITLNEDGCVISIYYNDCCIDDGTISPAVGNLVYLEELWIRERNSVHGPIPSEIGNLSNLQILKLSQNALTGEIPSEIGNLSNLTSLGLGVNDLSGEIPAELWDLTNLTSMGLCGNNLSGTIAPEVGNLINLKSLVLCNNNLSGSIPAEIGNLIDLEYLYLNNNQLDGAIPPAIGDLNNLDYLNLSDNLLTGTIPASIGNLTNLSELRIDNNQISGLIPPEIGNLSNLILLYADYNLISGELPLEFSGLSDLQVLNLNNNNLSGSFPVVLAGLNSLSSLRINDNDLSGCYSLELSSLCNSLSSSSSSNSKISNGNNFDESWEDFCDFGAGSCAPGCLDSLACNYDPDADVENGICYYPGSEECAFLTCAENDSLALLALYNSVSGLNWDLSQPVNSWEGITLNINGCVISIDLAGKSLTGTLTPELGSMYYLEELEMNSNELTGTIPSELGNLKNLEKLDLTLNDLSGTIPPEIGNISTLEFLNLNFNQLSGSIPIELGNLLILKTLNLNNNQLTGPIPIEFENFQSIRYIHLNENQLTGPIPVELSYLTTLRGLVMASNQLSGTIPPEIGNLINMQFMSFGNNLLTGTIPPEIGDLTSLYSLGLNGNQLTGPIPSQFDNLINMRFLLLNNNQLTGTIPGAFGSFEDLEVLILSYNDLTGGIPATFGNLTNLTGLELRHNDLSGCYPPEIANLCVVMPPVFGYYISNGNNFDASFADFCTDGSGSCCPAFLSIDYGIYNSADYYGTIIEANNEVMTGLVYFTSDDHIELKAGFEVYNSADLNLQIGNCE